MPRRPSAPTSRARIWTGWLLARCVLIALLLTNDTPIGDVRYYLRGLSGEEPSAMAEYPQPGTWPTVLLAWVVGNDARAFALGFTALMLLADAAFLALLLRQRGSRAGSVEAAAWFWIVFGTAAGHVFVWRLDLYPALLVGVAAACLRAYPRCAAALLAVATTVKLWPGVLAAGLVGQARSRKSWARVATFAATVVAVCAGVALACGPERLLSPLSYQGVRGLQIESVAASWLMLRAHRDPGRWHIHYASSKSYEVTGPGVEAMLALSSVAMTLTLAFAALVALARLVRGGWHPRVTQIFFLAVALLLIVSNKVFSPQYLVWVGPLLAVIVAGTPALPAPAQPEARGLPGGAPHGVRRLAASAVACQRAVMCGVILGAALGSYLYPYAYDALIDTSRGAGAVPSVLLVLRNLVVVAAAAVTLCWLRVEASLARHVRQFEELGQLGRSPEPQ